MEFKRKLERENKKEVHKKCRSQIKYVGSNNCLRPYCPKCRKEVLKSEIKLIKIIDKH